MPYGNRGEVELLLRDMEAQKHKLKLTKDGKEKKIWIQGSVRFLPFGVYEYVFPKEDKDVVLTTLCFNEDRYSLGKIILGFLRRMIKCEKIPEFKTNLKYLWIKDNVNIIPVGIRNDFEITDADGEHKGWTHEAI
jgi:hypothetical protein